MGYATYWVDCLDVFYSMAKALSVRLQPIHSPLWSLFDQCTTEILCIGNGDDVANRTQKDTLSGPRRNHTTLYDRPEVQVPDFPPSYSFCRFDASHL